MEDDIGSDDGTEMFDLLRRWTSHDYRILTRPTEQEHEEQGTGGLQGV